MGTLFTSSTEFQTAVVVLDFCKAQMNVLLDTSKPDDLPNSFQNHIKVFNLLFVESFEIKNNGFSFEYEKRYYGFKNIGTENNAGFIQTIQDLAQKTNTTFNRFTKKLDPAEYERNAFDIDGQTVLGFDTYNAIQLPEVTPVVVKPVVVKPVVVKPEVKPIVTPIDDDCKEECENIGYNDLGCVSRWYECLYEIKYSNYDKIDEKYYYNCGIIQKLGEIKYLSDGRIEQELHFFNEQIQKQQLPGKDKLKDKNNFLYYFKKISEITNDERYARANMAHHKIPNIEAEQWYKDEEAFLEKQRKHSRLTIKPGNEWPKK